MRRDIKKFVSDIWKVFGEDNFGTTTPPWLCISRIKKIRETIKYFHPATFWEGFFFFFFFFQIPECIKKQKIAVLALIDFGILG